VVITLTYMRRNRVQAELAETYDVSQSTISRAITGITTLLEKLLRKYVPTADELDDQKQYVVDGTLLPAGHGPGIQNFTPASTRRPV
jgi:DDE superfamily endonuclease